MNSKISAEGGSASGGKCQKSKKGFTLIEALVFLFIFVVSTLSIYQAFNVGLNYIIETKKKMGAVGIANEEIEKRRNLGYENLSVGAEMENAEIVRNGVKYYVTVNITYEDDPIDGLCGEGDGEGGEEDPACHDYYIVGITVKWDLASANKKITMSALISPPVMERDADLGYMRLHIIDQDGNGLAGAKVRVFSLTENKSYYLGNVNDSGNLFLFGLEPGNYKITVLEDGGNFPVETLDESGGFVPESEFAHVEIFAKTLSEKYIQTDKTSELNVALKKPFAGSTAISGLGFTLYGGKLLGRTGEIADYSFPAGEDPHSENGSDGTESYSDLSFGPYFFDFTDLNDGTTDYVFLWMTPLSDNEDKISLDAGSSLDVEALLAPVDKPSLLVQVVEIVEGFENPIMDAEVRLQRVDDPVYDLTLETNQFGKAFFPENEDGLSNEQYSLTVSAPGYSPENKNVTINNFTTEKIEISES